MRMFPKFSNILRRFASDQRGSIAIIYAAAGLLIIGFMALAVDGARAHILRSQLHYAVDSAAIAIGKELKSLTDAELLALAQKYVRANVSPSLLGLSGDFGEGDLNVALYDGQSSDYKEIRATAKLRTTMLGLVDGASTVDIEKKAVVRREIRGLELALALDVTGSMEWNSGTPGLSRIAALKAAATDLLDIIFEGNATHPKVWISVVPFTQNVNAKVNLNWIDSSTANPPMPTPNYNESYTWNPTPDLLGGSQSVCFGKRTIPPWDEDATPPQNPAQKFPAGYEYDYTYRGYWSNKYQYYVKADAGYRCPHNPHTILPLTNVRASIESHINALVPHGGTATDRGAVWGWRAISEKWRGYWNVSDASHPFDNDEPLNDKVVVLMTDGINSYPSTSDPALTRICNKIKADGVTLISINFATPESLYPLYENCASSPDLFFPAATGDQLRNTFRAIALQLSVLRLVE